MDWPSCMTMFNGHLCKPLCVYLYSKHLRICQLSLIQPPYISKGSQPPILLSIFLRFLLPISLAISLPKHDLFIPSRCSTFYPSYLRTTLDAKLHSPTLIVNKHPIRILSHPKPLTSFLPFFLPSSLPLHYTYLPILRLVEYSHQLPPPTPPPLPAPA